MKVVIFAGGLGSRLSESTNKSVPKPLYKINGRPMICHVMNIFINQGFNNFLILTGYKSQKIKTYFHKNYKIYENCKIKIKYTGVHTMTGKRLYLAKEELTDRFFLSYSDGLSNVNLKQMLNFHIKNKNLGTVLAVRPPARFGELFLKKTQVIEFKEKQQMKTGWINGGFFVLEKNFLDFVSNKNVMFENDPVDNAIYDKNLGAFRHNDFWQCVDTKRDYKNLLKLCKNKKIPPWLNLK